MKILYATVLILLSFSSFGAAPTVPSSNLWFGAIDGGYINLGWTAGNGARRLMICKAGSPVTFVPQDGVDYAENTAFGSGQEVAPGEFVVYDHFSTSFYLTNLSPATQYFFRIYDYNGSGATTEYLTSAFLSGSGTTVGTPTTQTSNAVFSNITTNSVNINWTSGNGTRRLIVVREGSPVNADPVSGTSYAVSFQFGNGAATGPGNYTVYNNTGVGTNVANLKPGTEYHFAFYEFNGSSQPQYKTPAYTTSVTTRSIPTVATTNLQVVKADGKELFLNWTSGNGQRRIVIAKEGSDVTATPVDGTDYTANAQFGAGQALAPGEYVVYDDNFHATSISGLNPGTTYYFKIFEYDGTGANTVYLTSAFASVSGSTVTTPTTQSSAVNASDVAPTSLRLHLTAGDGRARVIIGRKGAAVNVTPADFTVYNDNGNFGTGDHLGDGNYVVGNTTDQTLTVQGLEANTTYHFAVFEYNGFNQPLYLAPAATISATTASTLPVSLARFEATAVGNKVRIQWTTSSELNTSHFIIERSADGNQFSPVANIPAAGNSQSQIDYSREDNDPLPGKSYYRLKMVDIDGQTSYSAVRTILFSSVWELKILGNPVRDQLELISSSPVSGQPNKWIIVNAAGQAMQQGTISSSRTEINVSALARGTYWIKVAAGNEVKTLGFIKQ